MVLPFSARRRCCCALLALSSAACSSVVKAPATVRDPVVAFLLEEALHTGLVLPPAPGASGSPECYVEFGFGDWGFYALEDTGWWGSLAAVLWPTNAALARRRFDASTPDALRARAQRVRRRGVEASTGQGRVRRPEHGCQRTPPARVFQRVEPPVAEAELDVALRAARRARRRRQHQASVQGLLEQEGDDGVSHGCRRLHDRRTRRRREREQRAATPPARREREHHHGPEDTRHSATRPHDGSRQRTAAATDSMRHRR